MYCSQLQVEAYLGRSLTDEESAFFPTLASGVADYIDTYCARTFIQSRANTSAIDNTVGAQTSDPFQRFDGGDVELFFDQPLQTDTTIEDSNGDPAVITPYIGAYDAATGDWQLADPTTYTFYPRNSKVKTSVMTYVGVFPYGLSNVFVYGTFGDYLTAPAGIQLAASTLCGHFFNSTGDFKTETIEGYSYTLNTEYSDLVDKLLANYRRVVL